MVQPSEGERYYLRILLTHVKGATSFDNLKMVNGHLCRSFKEACILLGLLQDDTEWDTCLYQASNIKSGKQMLHLFAMILLFCQPMIPENLWNNHKSALSEEILYQNRHLTQNQNRTNISNAIENEVLNQLEHYLSLNGKSLKDFPNMPLPSERMISIDDRNKDLNQLIQEEKSYNVIELEKELH